MTKVFNDYGKKNKLLKENEQLSGEDIREGLTAIVSVKLRILSLKDRQSRNLETVKHVELLIISSEHSWNLPGAESKCCKDDHRKVCYGTACP